MSDQLADFELKLKRALSPVDPPRELEARLERTLGSLVDMAAEELEAWELSTFRDPRNWSRIARPVAAAAIGSSAAVGLVLVRDPAQAARGATRPAAAVDLARAHRARSRARSPARRRRRVLIRERALARRNEPTPCPTTSAPSPTRT